MSFTPQKLTVPDVLPIARAYVRMPENELGGNLHIVLEDFNVRTEDVLYCYTGALDHDDHLGAALALLLATMSRTQRLKIAHECRKDTES